MTKKLIMLNMPGQGLEEGSQLPQTLVNCPVKDRRNILSDMREG